MSVYQTASTPKYRFRSVLASFLQQEGLPFSSVLSEERILFPRRIVVWQSAPTSLRSWMSLERVLRTFQLKTP